MQKPLSVVRGKNKQTELTPIHDFAAKLTQPSLIEHLRAYVRWQAELRRERSAGKSLDELLAASPELAPISINLDLTTACNYACDHCVDMDILNTGIMYDDQKLFDSLALMRERGLRSVIVIGGGEPTVYPRFPEVIRHMKALGLKVGIVTNGSRMEKILEVADAFEAEDWVRLSLDSGSDATFQAMHKPKGRGITLDKICSGIRPVKERNPKVTLGFSFIIVWRDCTANEATIHENVHEMVEAAQRAKAAGFDYISFKPFLTRAERNNAEIVGLTQQEQHMQEAMAQIRRNVEEAKKLADASFRVIESTNLKVLENGTWRDYTDQPRTCHMTFFRQVLSPLGLFNCPVYRHVEQAKVGDKHGYSGPAERRGTTRDALRLIEAFDATNECREVTCLYNHANWFIEELIEHPERLDALLPSEERLDFFL